MRNCDRDINLFGEDKEIFEENISEKINPEFLFFTFFCVLKHLDKKVFSTYALTFPFVFFSFLLLTVNLLTVPFSVVKPSARFNEYEAL